MSEIIQWVIVGLIVAAAAAFLVKRLKPVDHAGCGGCPYAGACQHKDQRGSRMMIDVPSSDSSGSGAVPSDKGEYISSGIAL